MLKKAALILTILIFASVALLLYNGHRLDGKYYFQDFDIGVPKYEFTGRNTVLVWDLGTQISGKYEIQGDTVIVTYTVLGLSIGKSLTISDNKNKLTDDAGVV